MYQLTQLADDHHRQLLAHAEAQRPTQRALALARATRRARRAHTHRPGHPAPAHPATVVDRLLAALGARSSA